MLASEDLKKSLEKMTHHPGVYQMLDADGTLFYVCLLNTTRQYRALMQERTAIGWY